MPRFIDCVQGSPEWHSYRAGSATASRFDDIMAGKGAREAYLYELVAERLSGPMRDSGGVAREWGTQAEDLARRAYMERTGELVQQVGFAIHDRIKWCGASSDGLVLPHRKIGLEIKSPFNSGIHARTLALGMPDGHYWQVHGNIMVLDLEEYRFLSFDPAYTAPLDLYIEPVKRNESSLKHLTAEVKKFLAEVAVATRDIQNSNNQRKD